MISRIEPIDDLAPAPAGHVGGDALMSDACFAPGGVAVVRGQVHCYSEEPEAVAAWASLGFHLSFAGTLTFERSDRLRQALRRVPEERLLFETDAPYLAPAPHRGRRNEPAFVVATVAAAARERACDA